MYRSYVAFPTPSRGPKVLYSGLSFTQSLTHLYTNEWLLPSKALPAPLGAIRVECLAKGNSTCGQWIWTANPSMISSQLALPSEPQLPTAAGSVTKDLRTKATSPWRLSSCCCTLGLVLNTLCCLLLRWHVFFICPLCTLIYVLFIFFLKSVPTQPTSRKACRVDETLTRLSPAMLSCG